MVKSGDMKIRELLRQSFLLSAVIFMSSALLGSSVLPGSDRTERVRTFTRQNEFEFVAWIVDALRMKLFADALGASNYMTEDSRRQIVLDYLGIVSDIQRMEGQIEQVYADPSVSNPSVVSVPLRSELSRLHSHRDRLKLIVESIFQNQISEVVGNLGLTLGGQPLPPVLFNSTPLPLALIVSPRDIIRQDESIALFPDMSVNQQVALEANVDQALDVSSLVVPIGGLGVYPTMVTQTSNLEWLTEVVAHEWVHNFLQLRPLGLNYLTSPELRTMNETVASIAGKEIGRAVLERYYPELLPPPSPPTDSNPQDPSEPWEFDFRKEMHLTRVNVDRILKEGKVEAAEDYMEDRRRIFWENGYRGLRKLNQAYFAFHGAYADEALSAAGEDPVGKAVRELRASSPSLASFLNRISWMYSFDQLQRAVASIK